MRIRPSLRLAAVGALALALAAAAASRPAPADAGLGVACPDPTARVFLPWKDAAFYAFAPNGGFESSFGWALTGGAKVVAGNEPFFVHGRGDAYSLSLPAGSMATSPPMCISLLSGKMRFFTANSGAATSALRVQVFYRGGLGSLLGVLDAGVVTSGAAWQPSPPVAMLGGVLPLLTQYVQFRFTPADATGDWRIDDVYLDPLMHG